MRGNAGGSEPRGPSSQRTAAAPAARRTRGRARAALAIAVLCGASVARADEPKPRTVLVAPLSSLGAQDTSAGAKQIQADLERAVAAIPGTAVIGSKAALDRIKKTKRPELKVCEGDVACLTELGALLGAELVVAGEAGGLGDVQVVYLELVDVAGKKSVRSTTLEVGDTASGGALGAAYRLLAPERYAGTLTLDVDTAGATVYVDGKKVGKSSAKAPTTINQYVGTHALRVTHPEYRDFVRFVDVGFDADTRVEVALQQFPIFQTELAGSGGPAGNVTYVDRPTPWYRKWWAIATFSGIVFVGAAAAAGIIADGVDADTVRPVTP